MVIASHLIVSYLISPVSWRGCHPGGWRPARTAAPDSKPLLSFISVSVFLSFTVWLLRRRGDGTFYGICVDKGGRSYDGTLPGASIYGCYVALVCERAHAGHRGNIGLVEKKKTERRSGICRCMHKTVTHIIPTSIDCCFGWLVMQCHREKVTTTSQVRYESPTSGGYRRKLPEGHEVRRGRRSIWMRQKRCKAWQSLTGLVLAFFLRPLPCFSCW